MWQIQANSHWVLLLHAAGPVPAYANYSHFSQHASGFGQLRVETSPHFSNSVQMQAAGFVEGYLTALQINDHWHNERSWLLSQTQDVDRVYSWYDHSSTGSNLWGVSQYAQVCRVEPVRQAESGWPKEQQHLWFKQLCAHSHHRLLMFGVSCLIMTKLMLQ